MAPGLKPDQNLRQNVLTKQDSSSQLRSKTLQRNNSNRNTSVSRSNSLKDVNRSNSINKKDVSRTQVTVRRVPSTKTRDKTDSSQQSQVSSVRRTNSRRDESPAARQSRLGLKNASPNTSNLSLKTSTSTSASGVVRRVTRTDSLRKEPVSRSSSLTRCDTGHRTVVSRQGVSTLPRDHGHSTGQHRSRSQGDYVTVLEIGGSSSSETRSKSARPVLRSGSRDTSLGRTVSRSSSMKRGEQSGAGTVSVHIKHSQDSRPAAVTPVRKQSIKIGRLESAENKSSRR